MLNGVRLRQVLGHGRCRIREIHGFAGATAAAISLVTAPWAAERAETTGSRGRRDRTFRTAKRPAGSPPPSTCAAPHGRSPLCRRPPLHGDDAARLACDGRIARRARCPPTWRRRRSLPPGVTLSESYAFRAGKPDRVRPMLTVRAPADQPPSSRSSTKSSGAVANPTSTPPAQEEPRVKAIPLMVLQLPGRGLRLCISGLAGPFRVCPAHGPKDRRRDP